MRKLILRCGLSPGDIVMMTAAVRDLHRCYPGRFLTDVRTVCPDLWENNPHITPLKENEPLVEQIDCAYPLINHCNRIPYHCLHGFIQFLNQRLHLGIRPSAFKGDIQLSSEEKSWCSQVQELTGQDTPFWIIAAGGKHDVTIKWWDSARYQEAVDHFRGKIQFVQVGAPGDHHPRLAGVIDFRGQTTLRELVRLVYHAQGVLCSVTALMHLAAAVEVKNGRPAKRPCVAIAGGREPAHWEAYPDHQFIHTNGALRCCAQGGCWKDRTSPLRDGDSRDRPGRRCVDVVGGVPRCMAMITSAEVIHRISLYFEGGSIRYLSPYQRSAAERGVMATANNSYDNQPLDLHSAGLACERFIQKLSTRPEKLHGRGIVICGGGARYFTCAWVCINMLRHLGCALPVQFWYLGKREMNEQMRALLAPLGVECVDAYSARRKIPARILHGYELKPYAILHCPFREVLLLDADNVPVRNPEYLFGTPEFQSSGAIFWPDYDYENDKKKRTIWRSCGLTQPNEPEFETGQIVVDKGRCWSALSLTMWFNENSDFYYEYLQGDKETFHLAFRKLKQGYSLVPFPIQRLEGTMCQHDFEGNRLFQHRNMDKWDLFLRNKQVSGFRFEQECRDYIVQLRSRWDGGISLVNKQQSIWSRSAVPKRRRLEIDAIMISCAQRARLRCQTLDRLAKTDWGQEPPHLEIDPGDGDDYRKRQTHCAYLALKRCLERPADYLFFLEDDLDFNQHLRHNLEHWELLRSGGVTLASLYNPRVPDLACDIKNRARVVHPQSVFGSQALLISRGIVAHLVEHWEEVKGMQDIRIAKLAGRLRNPVFYHSPSLVQHTGRRSLWGGKFHQAADFDPCWKAP
jgi:Mannosyltransferase putative/Glycosyltransferase family 9 (heptosyltransferase)